MRSSRVRVARTVSAKRLHCVWRVKVRMWPSWISARSGRICHAKNSDSGRSFRPSPRRLPRAGVRSLAVKADVTDEADVEAAFRQIGEEFGQLDILCNNAGGGTGAGPVDRTDVLDLDRSDWDYTLGVSLTSTFLCSKHGGRLLRKTGRGGAIVNTVSISAHRGMPGGSAYAAAKFALVNFTATLALELSPHGIRVNAISPGMTMTPICAAAACCYCCDAARQGDRAGAGRMGAQHASGRAATPDEMAAVADFWHPTRPAT